MSLIVQKYGGTSVGNPERILNVARRIIATQDEGNKVVAVVSAMSGVTDSLIKLAKDVSPHPTDREMDVLQKIASGKTVSEIANELSLSVNTISTYRARLLEKLSLANNAALTRYAIDHALI